MEEGARTITRQEYVSRLHELKDEIVRAWHAGDRVTSLKQAIKVTLLKYVSLTDFFIFSILSVIIARQGEKKLYEDAFK